MRHADEFTEFCRSEYGRLVGSLALFCGDPDIAGELAHEALMRAHRDWRKVRGLNSPAAWVLTVGMNLARSHFRRKKAEARARERLERETTPASGRDEEAIAIRAAVGGLGRRQRTAIVLRFYADLQIDDIAQAMDCSASTVKSLLRASLEQLRAAEGFTTFKEANHVG